MTVFVDEPWKPNDRQADFLRIPDDCTEGFYGGAAGGGKSEIILMLPIVREFYKHPSFKGIIFRRTFPELDESLIPRAKAIYNKIFGAKYNDSKHQFTFPSGATIKLSYLETDDDARSHDTAEFNYIGYDELTHFTEFQYTYLISRCRSSIKGLPAFVRSASNPGHVGHTWVRARFVEPCKEGYTRIIDKGSGTSRIFIPAKVTDNPYILEATPDYVNKLKLLPIAEQKAKLEGDWWAYSGLVFTEFRTVRYPDEPPNAIHVVDSFTIPEWWPKIIAIDWGWAANTCVLFGAISPEGRIVIYREYVVSNTYIANWAPEVAKWAQLDGNIVACVLDPSAWQKRGEAKTIADQIIEHSGMMFQQADNDRIGGKMLIHEYLRWIQKTRSYIPPGGFQQDIANRILRISGTKAYNEYIMMFQEQPPETNLPKLLIFKRECPNLVNVLTSCVYEEAKSEGKKPEDVKEFNGDDPYDCIRYLLKHCHYFIEDAIKTDNRLKRLGEIQDRLATTGDMTVYYNQMRLFEKTNQAPKTIMRRH